MVLSLAVQLYSENLNWYITFALCGGPFKMFFTLPSQLQKWIFKEQSVDSFFREPKVDLLWHPQKKPW